MKKTIEECCQEVAKKHGLGSTLVMGHKKSYWIEATEMYATQFQHPTPMENKTAEQVLSVEFDAENRDDLRLFITLNPSLEKIEKTMELYASLAVEEKERELRKEFSIHDNHAILIQNYVHLRNKSIDKDTQITEHERTIVSLKAEIERLKEGGVMRVFTEECPSCKHIIITGNNFCQNCGHQFTYMNFNNDNP